MSEDKELVSHVSNRSHGSHTTVTWGGGSHLAAGKTKTGNVGDLWSLRWSEMEEGRAPPVEMSLAWWMSNSACTPGFQLQGSTQGPQYYSLTSITSQVPASPSESWLPLGLM